MDEVGTEVKQEKKCFDAREWTNKKIEMRTIVALLEKDAQFVEQHQHSPNMWLLKYLREQAGLLGHTPNMEEIVGGNYIAGKQ